METYPEDVVEEEATEENATVQDLVQLQELNTVDGKSQAEDVVGNPVLERKTIRPAIESHYLELLAI